ncbi:16S rRNA (uracil(1498)-N(3))-methyltransferase [Scatolibacter rhodanostii]|uniref:16S rRNA (uracil(1498)-N(3))-methyltransferase n=1 Tax=Scatolibacter rhodanostii TaxID=2014781 RepID=UPI000C08AB79|nr:16S rRNA (uracil(1498)-N(3))-methyltransferase [Scatolibacter rhodanostii]
MPRFFIDTPLGDATQFLLDGENGRHISRSLRMKTGDELVLCDKLGTDYECEIQSFQEDMVVVKILSAKTNETEPATKIHLYQSLPKKDKLESVVQKVTELGCISITPVESERCISKLTDKNTDKKLARLQKIALEAAKQSGRGIIPLIHSPLSFNKAIKQAAAQGDVLFFYEKGGTPLSTAIAHAGNTISVFIGPEGGYAQEEADFAIQHKAIVCTLGKRILRTETAPVAALSALLFAKGDME